MYRRSLRPVGTDIMPATAAGGSRCPAERRGCALQPAGHVHRVADHGVLQPALAADVAQHRRSVMEADADLDRRQAARRALAVPGGDRRRHRVCAIDGAGGVAVAGARRPEGRHDGVADIAYMPGTVSSPGPKRHDFCDRRDFQ